jgi:hypothetical protein
MKWLTYQREINIVNSVRNVIQNIGPTLTYGYTWAGLNTNSKVIVVHRAPNFNLTSPAHEFVVQQKAADLVAQQRRERVGAGRIYLLLQIGGGGYGRPSSENFENKGAKSCIVPVFLCKILSIKTCKINEILYDNLNFISPTGQAKYMQLLGVPGYVQLLVSNPAEVESGTLPE